LNNLFGSERDWVKWSQPGGTFMATVDLTPEQRRLIEEAGDKPVHIEDPALDQTYVVIRADVYERVRDLLEPKSVIGLQVPEGIRRSQTAFFRDLPELLKDRGMRGKYVAYNGDDRVKVGRSQTEVVRECLKRGLSDAEYDVFIIEPQSPEAEEVDYPSAWYEG
jgi:hypothetical protein